jgi:hypothetical protein
MEPIEFLSFRGKQLEAKVMWLGNQEVVMAAIHSNRVDSLSADVYAQQKIDIKPGLKITNKKSGKEFEVLSHPAGYSRHVTIKDSRRDTMNSITITEEDLRQNYRFVG